MMEDQPDYAKDARRADCPGRTGCLKSLNVKSHRLRDTLVFDSWRCSLSRAQVKAAASIVSPARL
jgi:hypothetical protein